MKMLRMVEKMEMGKMGERKSIGSFCMRVGIFVSMYFTSLSLFFLHFVQERREIKKKQFNKVTVFFSFF